MKRKEFLKKVSILASATLVAQHVTGQQKKVIRKNWGGAYPYTATELQEPENVTEVVAFVRSAKSQKALGSRHSFNGIADDSVRQLSLRKLNKMVSLDAAKRSAVVEGGIRYEELAPELDKRGFALHNLASLPSVTVAGACATATHGSGSANGNLATGISALEFVSAGGEVVKLSRKVDGDVFNGAVVNLGAIGIITQMTLDVQPTYDVRQDIFQNMPLSSVRDHFAEVMQSGYSVSLFTDWKNDKISEVWVKRRTDQPIKNIGNDFFGAAAATRNLHPVERFSPEACTAQLGVAGKWYDRLPHFKIGALPADGSEIQSEYFIPMKNGVEAILAVTKKADIIFPQLLISEVRTVAADNLWMSPCYHEACMGIHFTWKNNWQEVQKILPVIEAELMPFGARPHWGKTFTMSPKRIHEKYERLGDFVKLVEKYDPSHKFRNDFLKQNIFSA